MKAKPIEDNIRFIGPERPQRDIKVTLEFTNNDGYCDCEIHYDGIPVAYLDTSTGGIIAMVFELHNYTEKNKQFWDSMKQSDAEALREIRHLESKGVEFEFRDEHTKQYCIKLEKGFY